MAIRDEDFGAAPTLTEADGGLWSPPDLTAAMYSVLGTLALNGIDVLRWLEAWLEACAKNGGKPPDDLSPWLPWTMSEERRREFMTPE